MTPFVVLEGLDACGKDTVGDWLAVELGAAIFRFPDAATPLGALVRAHLAGKWRASGDGSGDVGKLLDAAVHQGLQTAHRLERADEISGALAAGRPVVAVRYHASGIAYGAADGLDWDWLVALQRPLLQPTVSILLDVDYATSVQRRRARRDRYEVMGEEFYARVRANYARLWHDPPLPGRWSIVDAREPLETVKAFVMEAAR